MWTVTEDILWFFLYLKQAVGGQQPQYAPAPILPRWRRSALRHWADGNVAAVSHSQHVPTPTAAAAWRANTVVSKAAWWLGPFDLESGVRDTCDVGYLCASFGLHRALCSWLRPDVRDRRQTALSLYAPPIRDGGIESVITYGVCAVLTSWDIFWQHLNC